MNPVFSCPLAYRGVIRIGGEDRRSFLQGLISNDIQLCAPGAPIYAALLTPQGKFLHDLFITDAGDSFLVDCEAARADDLLKRLAMYKLRAKVTLAPAPEYEVWAMSKAGNHNASPLTREATPRYPLPPAGGEGGDPMRSIGEGEGGLVYLDPRQSALGYRAIVKRGSITARPTDFEIYDLHRLALAIADGSRDIIIEKSTLLESNFDRVGGISWTKGCYMGQELTARMHHRGLVKKRLFPVEITGPAPAFGAIITMNGEDIGDMRSSCRNRGLALLNVEKAEAALKIPALLACGASQLTVLI